MIIDKTHRTWIAVTLVLLAVSTVLYVLYVRSAPNGPSGGSWQGLWFGIAGSALMVFAGLLSARKKTPRSRLGTAKTWLRGHIWLGLLSVPLILFHSGFRFGGLLEQALMAVFFIVIFSGLLGVVLQTYLPRLLKTGVPAEAIYEQMPQACAALRRSADETVVEACGSLTASSPSDTAFDPRLELKSFYLQTVRPFLSLDPGGRGSGDVGRISNSSQSEAMFAQLREALPAGMYAPLDSLRSVVDERRALDAQLRMHHWLHGWLFLHVPLSLALLVLGAVHAVMSVYY